ncbi:MAG: hypothetical protein IKI57_00155 [Clostridia bacterium]|nr:hypothetical protein [Clostridia bacterium]
MLLRGGLPDKTPQVVDDGDFTLRDLVIVILQGLAIFIPLAGALWVFEKVVNLFI